MNTLLQFVLLLSLIVGVVGGCGMEMPYVIVTAVLIKLAWVVISWWRTFQHERDNRWLHRRLAYGAAMILLLSISQFAISYLTSGWEDDAWSEEEFAAAMDTRDAASLPTASVPTAPLPVAALPTTSRSSLRDEWLKDQKPSDHIDIVKLPHSQNQNASSSEPVQLITMDF